MINPEMIQFLMELEQNNEKVWFEAHRADYKKLRAEFTEFLQDLAEQIAYFDPVVQMQLGDPKLVKVFRINRDMRFSKDKRPYKTNIGGTIGGAGETQPLYYLSIEPGSSMAGGGLYMPPANVLHTIREKVDTDYATVEAILNSESFRAAFPDGLTQEGALKTAPRGYSTDHPAIGLLRLKSFAAIRGFSDEEVVQEDFGDRIHDIYEALSELNAYLKACAVRDENSDA